MNIIKFFKGNDEHMGSVFALKDDAAFVICQTMPHQYALATIVHRNGANMASYIAYVDTSKGDEIIFQGVKAFAVNTGLPIDLQQKIVAMISPRRVDAMGNFLTFI